MSIPERQGAAVSNEEPGAARGSEARLRSPSNSGQMASQGLFAASTRSRGRWTHSLNSAFHYGAEKSLNTAFNLLMQVISLTIGSIQGSVRWAPRPRVQRAAKDGLSACKLLSERLCNWMYARPTKGLQEIQTFGQKRGIWQLISIRGVMWRYWTAIVRSKMQYTVVLFSFSSIRKWRN